MYLISGTDSISNTFYVMSEIDKNNKKTNKQKQQLSNYLKSNLKRHNDLDHWEYPQIYCPISSDKLLLHKHEIRHFKW